MLEKRITLQDDTAAAAVDSGIFGINCTESKANLVILPVRWEATVSYGSGTAKAPEAILSASHQVDLFDLSFGKIYEYGICLSSSLKKVASLSKEARKHAQKVIDQTSKNPEKDCKKVNELSHKVNELVYAESKRLLQDGKFVAVLGGDHSCPLGLMQALSEKYKDEGFGILHFDAHFDLRIAYEGFTYSHASIMYNALNECANIKNIVAVGIRDFSKDEMTQADKSRRVYPYYSRAIAKRLCEGESFKSIADEMIKKLPKNVYISFDIDGLDPALCPTTGTPVPGGLSFEQAVYILEQLKNHKKTVIGFDLVEVAPQKGSEWDANVGARLLYLLCGTLFTTNLKT
jgi:agmatinase